MKLSQIIKTMLLTNKKGDTVVAVLPGHRRLDAKRLRKKAGIKDLQFMDREAIEQKPAWWWGPWRLWAGLWMDCPCSWTPMSLRRTLVDISSGDPSAGVELKSADLKQLLSHASVTVISKE